MKIGTVTKVFRASVSFHENRHNDESFSSKREFSWKSAVTSFRPSVSFHENRHGDKFSSKREFSWKLAQWHVLDQAWVYHENWQWQKFFEQAWLFMKIGKWKSQFALRRKWYLVTDFDEIGYTSAPRSTVEQVLVSWKSSQWEPHFTLVRKQIYAHTSLVRFGWNLVQ